MAAKIPARTRVLDTASRLFYAEGVHAVGVDRIIAEAGVAKATFYHHFKAKDDLVVAYVRDNVRRQRETVAPLLASASPREALYTVFRLMGEFGSGPGYRGCPFLNAAAEYPDPEHPVRRAVGEYRVWFRDGMRDLLAADGHPDAERTADMLLVLRDGLAAGFHLDDPVRLRALIADLVERTVTPVASGR